MASVEPQPVQHWQQLLVVIELTLLDQQLSVGQLEQAMRSIGSAKIKITGLIPTEVTLLPPPQ
jgi:hypothetical protein